MKAGDGGGRAARHPSCQRLPARFNRLPSGGHASDAARPRAPVGRRGGEPRRKQEIMRERGSHGGERRWRP